ncbi:D-Tyr-tRNA (Tyr) deacylase [Trachipleistophora hominis]|uniref:D-aminoacyl-tRNA deacylase n=1 Tax=Trachipleistophora hominis TaxID=72359 RepID=L7JRG1_TRAHO|nr:D-Tyr-tRNA (Tyr) deacylase [Trachipleistophora hominis]
MQLIIQKVKRAQVTVNNTPLSSISEGLLIYVGFHRTDTPAMIHQAVQKIKSLRLFNDTPLADHHHIMLISNVTLYARMKGNKLDYHMMMEYADAKRMFECMVGEMRKVHGVVETGQFGSKSVVECAVDGPFNFLYEIGGRMKDRK